jgi:hypothetical protein
MGSERKEHSYFSKGKFMNVRSLGAKAVIVSGIALCSPGLYLLGTGQFLYIELLSPWESFLLVAMLMTPGVAVAAVGILLLPEDHR